MKNVVVKFGYMSAKGEITPREVFVIHADSNSFTSGAITGFDLNKLDKGEADQVKKAFSDKEVTPVPPRKPRGEGGMDYDSLGLSKEIFTKAYRNFLTNRVLPGTLKVVSEG